jgi:hypothetical protein
MLLTESYLHYQSEEEKMNIEKKEWTKPELIILARTQPEEAVLLACKASEVACDNEQSKVRAVAPS